MARPTKLPRWDSLNAGSVEPAGDYQDEGFSAGDRPPAAWLNWLWRHSYLWIRAQILSALTEWTVTDWSIGSIPTDPSPLLFSDGDDLWFLLNGGPLKLGASGIHPDQVFIDRSDGSDGVGLNGSYALIWEPGSAAFAEYALPITGAAPTADTTGTALTSPRVTDIIWSEILGLWVAVLTGSDGGTPTLEVWTNPSTRPSTGAWTLRYTEATSNFSTGSAESPEGLIAFVTSGGNRYTSPDGEDWTKTAVSSAGGDPLVGCAYHPDTGDFFSVGSDGGVVSLINVTDDTSRQLGSLSDPHTTEGSAGGVAVDQDGGLMAGFTLYESSASVGDLGLIVARYFPPALDGGASNPITDDGLSAVILDDVGDYTTSGDQQWMPRGIHYDATRGAFYGFIQTHTTNALTMIHTRIIP